MIGIMVDNLDFHTLKKSKCQLIPDMRFIFNAKLI